MGERLEWRGQTWAAIPVALLEDSRLSPSARVLFGILAAHMIDKDHCWPGQQRLGESLGVTARAVRNYLKELQGAGWITVEQRQGGSSIYRLSGTSVPETPEPAFRTPRNQRSYEVHKEEIHSIGSEEVDAVFDHYLSAFPSKRQKKADEGQRKIIRAALEHGTADELKACIDACAASDWHQKRGGHEKRSGSKHNSLSMILAPKTRGANYPSGRSQREQIDYWLDRSEAPTADREQIIEAWVEARNAYARGEGPDPGASPWEDA